jgi:hypothetical protein
MKFSEFIEKDCSWHGDCNDRVIQSSLKILYHYINKLSKQQFVAAVLFITCNRDYSKIIGLEDTEINL